MHKLINEIKLGNERIHGETGELKFTVGDATYEVVISDAQSIPGGKIGVFKLTNNPKRAVLNGKDFKQFVKDKDDEEFGDANVNANPMTVFGIAFGVIINNIKDNQPPVFIFHARNENRDRLYTKIINKFSKEISNYKLIKRNVDGIVNFYLVREDSGLLKEHLVKEANIGIAGSEYLEPLYNLVKEFIDDFFKNYSNKRIRKDILSSGKITDPVLLSKKIRGKLFKFNIVLGIFKSKDVDDFGSSVLGYADINQTPAEIRVNFKLSKEAKEKLLNNASTPITYGELDYNSAVLSTIKHELGHFLKFKLGYKYKSNPKSTPDASKDTYYMYGDEWEAQLIDVFHEIDDDYNELKERVDKLPNNHPLKRNAENDLKNFRLTDALRTNDSFHNIRDTLFSDKKLKSVNHERFYKKLLSKIVEYWKRKYPENKLK